MNSRHQLRSCHRLGLTNTDVLAIIVIIIITLVLMAVLVPSLSDGGRPRRTICSANLKAISTGFASCASANNEHFPCPASMPAEVDEVGKVRYAPGKIGTHRESKRGRS